MFYNGGMMKALYGTTMNGVIVVLDLGPTLLQTLYSYHRIEQRQDIYSTVLKEGAKLQWDDAPQIMESHQAHEKASQELEDRVASHRHHALNPPRFELGPIEEHQQPQR